MSRDDASRTLEAGTIRAQVDAVLADDVYWFPVRHHSPAVSRHLEAAIHARRPKILFIEGPFEANDLIAHILDAKTKPPVAIYSSYRDDNNVLGLAGIASPAPDIPPRFSCWYPLLAYSPEYVALAAANKLGAQTVFMDLPHYALIRKKNAGLAEQPAPGSPGEKPPSTHAVAQETDKLIVESGFYQRLAEVAGYRSWDEAWDSLFEIRDFVDFEEFRRELATFCAAARATSVPQRVAEDGTLERERFMRQTIAGTLRAKKIKPEHAVIVCGGFHLFMDHDDPQPPPEPPSGTVFTTVVPYSFFRVSELSGYGAGNQAPQFYQTSWDLEREGRKDDLLVEHIVAVLRQGRKEGEALSSADAIAIREHAVMLAGLRGRPRPVLQDIHDAIMTCCCKGDPADEGTNLLKAIDAADIGVKIGRVTPALGRLPVVNDFYAQLDDLGMGEALGKEKRVTHDLDKREEPAAKRSVFLHRLRYLKVPLGELVEAPRADFATGKIFREKWALRWNPQVEAALIEQNLYGDSVEAAALARLEEDLAREELHAGHTCERLVRAIDMDLPHMIQEVEKACAKAIDNDTRFASLSQALSHLAVIDRYAVFHNLRRDLLGDLIVRCYDRACFAIPEVASVPEDQQQDVVNALLTLAEVIQRSERKELDRALFVENVRKAAEQSGVPFLRGVFLGMLTELREMTAEQLASELSALAQAPVEKMVTAGDFLDGILAVSRMSILIGADALIGAIDELLRAAEWEAFLVMVPRLRAAFERLHDRQRDALAARVAERYGLKEKESITELRASVAAVALISRIDQQVAAIMKKWDF